MERFSGTPNTQFIVNVERTVTDPYSDKLKTSRAALKAMTITTYFSLAVAGSQDTDRCICISQNFKDRRAREAHSD
jgi:hypothetical protein